MTNLIALLLIVSTAAAAPSGHRADTLERVFQCDFNENWDKNYDNWPDGWSRKSGPGYPHYLNIQLQSGSADDEAKRHLQVDLNGGSALLESPAVLIDASLAYVFTGSLKTVGLKHDRAFVSIRFYDANGEPVASYHSAKTTGTTDWRALHVGTLWPPASARHAKIALRVETGELEDLAGSVMLDYVRLTPLVRIDLSTGNPRNIFHSPEDVEVVCRVSGFPQEHVLLALELENALGDRLGQIELPIHHSAAPASAEQQNQADGPPEASEAEASSDDQSLHTGTSTWKPPVGTGFYRVRAKLVGAAGNDSQRDMTIAVVDRQTTLQRSEFGWSLPGGDRYLPLDDLPDLLSLAGVGWVKYPLWMDENDTAREDALSVFADRLNARRIRLIGMLAQPPAAISEQIPSSGALTPAHIFSADPSIWYPSLETTLTQMGMKTRWWQLGRDGDNSFVEYPELPARLDAVKAELVRAVPDVQIGIGWSWLDLPPVASAAPSWRFLSLSADPPLNARELIAHLDAEPSRTVQRWVQLVPLAVGTYDEKTRAVDLVERMMAAKMHGADAVFVPEPFSPEHGLMRADATPGSLLLPWRTTARALAGTKHAGSIRLPGGSQNDVFVRADEAVLLFRGDKPASEEVFLGFDARQVDIWGQSRALDEGDGRPTVEVGSLPTFVIGAGAALVRWRQAVDFQETRLPHVFGEAHANALNVFNPFDEGVSGTARLVMPDGWTPSPEQIPIQLGPGERLSEPLEVVLPFNADSGKQPVRIDFDIHVDRRYQFSVYRQLEVGLGEVAIDVVSRLNSAGELEVEQQLVNNTSRPVTFRCHLFAPRRLRQSKVVESRAQGNNTVVYVFPDGDELVGQSLWIRAEEIGGSRVLNRRFNAQR